MVDAVHQAGKKTVVNVELIGGFNLDRDGARFLKQIFHVDVVIVSNPMWTNYLKGLNLFVIQRIMLMDSLALENSLRIVSETSCDAVELRPSVYGIKYISRLRQTRADIAYFLAGFINTQKIIDEARLLQFKAVTLSNNKLWSYKTK